MRKLIYRLHDRLFGEPAYYAIYSLDDGNLIALSVNWFLVKFGSESELLFADRQDCEAIYAEGYYFDPRWMNSHVAVDRDLEPARVDAVGHRKFDELWDEWFPGCEYFD